MKPKCFKKFNKEKQFCLKICKYSTECSDGVVVLDEIDEIKKAKNSGVLTMQELCKYGMEAIKKRVENNKQTLI